MMKFKNELKRGFSMTVALAMCMGSLQVTALADDGENASGSDTASVSSDTAGNDAGAGESGAGESGAGESGAGESGADTDTGSNESSSTESKKETVSDTGRVEGETSTTTERDEEGRVTQEETTKTDSQTIITTETDTTITTETKTETETDPEELGDREQTKTEQGKPETIVDKENSASSEAVKDNLQVSFGVSADEELNNVKDQLPEGVEGVVNKYEINKDGIVAGLKNDADKSKGDKETELKTQGYKPVDGGWEKPILDNGKEVGKETVKVEVVEVKNDKGEIVGYKTVKTTTTTKYGEDYKVTEDTTEGQELSFERPEEATSSTEGPTLGVEFEENHTSTVVPETVPEGATAITDENGNTIGYTIETTIETTDPETGVTTTETRNEDVYFQVTETEVIGKTEKTDTEVFVSEDKIEGTVTETREDTVTVETITDEYILDVSQDTLDVTLGMHKVTEVEGNEHGFTVRLNESSHEVASWDDKDVLKVVDQFRKQFSENEFNEACIAGANINVTQNVCDSNGYNGTLKLNFKFNQSQLDAGIFRLEVTDEEGTKTYKIGKNEMGDFHKGFEDNGDGTQTFTLGNVGSSSDITIRLVGKMSMGDYEDENLGKIGIDQYFNYKTKVEVEIKEAKAKVETKQTEKTEKRKDTLTFERDKTITGTRTETVTTKTEVTTTETVNSWRTDSSSSYTYASAPVPAPDPTPTTPGDGPANNNTNNVVVADPDVPLAEIPETEVPLAEIPETEVPLAKIPDMEVPLADAPVEMDIPDEAVPMADVPAEVVIVDDAVPLADVPKTGDTSDIWYAAAVLSLGGWMLVSGRKREEEEDA